MRKEAKALAKRIKEPKEVNEPSLYQVAVSEMAKLVWVPINEDLSPDKMAFATKTPSNCYKVFVNKKIPERYHAQFNLHEYGHILFGHLKHDDLRTQQLTKKVLQFWPSIEPHIELDDEDKNKSKLDLVEKYIIPLQGLLQNYAMDMEVNSKLFPTEEERTEMKNITSIATMLAILNDEYVLDVQLDAIKQYLDEDSGEPFAKPIYPDMYGFPDQASYQEYLDYMFLNIDKFMNFLKRDMDQQGHNMPGSGSSVGQSGQGNKGQNNKGKTGKGQSGEGEGEGDGEGDESKDGKNGLSKKDQERLKKQIERDAMGNRKRLSLDDIERLRKAANKSDTDEEGNESTAASSGHGKDVDESGDVGNGSDGDGDWTGQKGLGMGHSKVKRPDVMPLGDGKQLARFLEREAFSKKVENVRVNEMYYYNRRKYGEKDIIAKQTTENVYRPGNLIIVVDCSGSIDRQAIQKMLNVTKQLSKKCGPRSRVIWWDTRLCADNPLRAKQTPISGGGTDIAEGIKYAHERYLKNSNDKLIIISDYCDSLGKWLKVCKNIKNDITGIAWTNSRYSKTESLDTFLSNMCWGDQFSVKEFKKKIHTKIVEI